ncbi:MOSC domain-containing protein [Rubellicoccus peritrichatus]|uniref:MOSC domain-containing protein n=1 Tax=Rubellicoccus peritrichatus TaxID=3080537 RepID=A0AAQ3LE21_9BACT|nr:MOSC N-terminal beta barrel domain-containing protein [Puniceicoccus sp. CR14]WOO42759.1 MOSC domain-containing protein [Puniceicoccus sp. CR14]
MHVESIWVYPIKSIGALALDEAEVDSRGFCLDRRWLVVDPKGWQPTQALRRTMFRIKPSIRGGELWLHAPDMPDLMIPLLNDNLEYQGKIETGFQCQATVMPELYSNWFSRYLNGEYHLVRMMDDDFRAVREDAGQEGDSLNFSDLSAVHLLNRGSMEDLNCRLDEPVSEHAFRPNLVFTSQQAYEEDAWEKVRIGDVSLDTGIPCPRCPMTLAHPETGELNKFKEPLKALSEYRKLNNRHAFFGQYFAVRQPGWIKVGDEIQVDSIKR